MLRASFLLFFFIFAHSNNCVYLDKPNNHLPSELEATNYNHQVLAVRYQLAFYNQTPNSYEDYISHWIKNPEEIFEYFTSHDALIHKIIHNY